VVLDSRAVEAGEMHGVVVERLLDEENGLPRTARALLDVRGVDLLDGSPEIELEIRRVADEGVDRRPRRPGADDLRSIAMGFAREGNDVRRDDDEVRGEDADDRDAGDRTREERA
jgi:hypothetical protein